MGGIDESFARPGLRALLDTNVILDVLLRREPCFGEAQPLIDARDKGHLVRYVPESAVTDVFYSSRRLHATR